VLVHVDFAFAAVKNAASAEITIANFSASILPKIVNQRQPSPIIPVTMNKMLLIKNLRIGGTGLGTVIFYGG